jgi:hypothetical protein
MYAEIKRKDDNKLNLKIIEEVISEYKSWIKKTNREDKIENYEKILRAE